MVVMEGHVVMEVGFRCCVYCLVDYYNYGDHCSNDLVQIFSNLLGCPKDT